MWRHASLTHLQFSDHPLDQVVSKFHPLQASLGGGDGVEDGRVYLIYVLLTVKSRKLTNDALKVRHTLFLVRNRFSITYPHTSLFSGCSTRVESCSHTVNITAQLHSMKNSGVSKPPFLNINSKRKCCGGCSQRDSQFKGLHIVFHTAIIHLSAERRNKIVNPSA